MSNHLTPLLDDVLSDVLPKDFAEEVIAHAAQTASRQHAQRQRLVATLIILVLLVPLVLWQLSTPETVPRADIPQGALPPVVAVPAPPRNYDLVTTHRDGLEIVRTREGLVQIIDTDALRYPAEPISDQELLAIFAARNPRLKIGPDGREQLIFSN